MIEAASDVANAINALRLKRHRLVPNGESVVIQQVGKPDLLLTYDAAREYRQQMQEAEA